MNKKGFTLIELMIVIAIIAIIAAIAIPSLIKSKIAANEGAAASSLKTMNGMFATFKKKRYCGRGALYPVGNNADTYVNAGKFCGVHYDVNNAGDAVQLIGAAEAAADMRADGNTNTVITDGSYIPVINTNTYNAQAAVNFSIMPKQGYWFALCQTMDATTPYAYTKGPSRNHYALQAIPHEYGGTGENTYIINEEGTVWTKDKGLSAYDPLYPTKQPSTDNWNIAD